MGNMAIQKPQLARSFQTFKTMTKQAIFACVIFGVTQLPTIAATVVTNLR
jgi:hypothetical protein